jgi:hypothetical protein
MLRAIVFCGCILAGWNMTDVAQGEEPSAARSLAKDVLTIQFSGRALPSLEFALWEDGYCVWRGTDRDKNGNFAHRCAKLPPEKFTEVVAGIKHAGFFQDKSLQDQKLGPDGAYYEITVKTKDDKLTMLSWHEPYEANGKVYMNARGALESLGGETLLAKLRQEPAEYLHYRMAWLELKSTLLAVRPSESKPCRGKVEMTDSGPVWQE